jgi:hypothetical protein
MTPLLADLGTLTVLTAGAVALLGGAVGSVLTALASRMMARAGATAFAVKVTAADDRQARDQVRDQLDRQRPPVDELVRGAVENVGRLNLRVTYRVENDAAGRPVVQARVAGPDGSSDVTLSGDDLRSEPAVRFQLLDAWSKVLRERSEQLLAGAPGAAEQ